MFIRYASIVGMQEGVDFLYAEDWTASEWAALEATGMWDFRIQQEKGTE